MPNQEEYKLAGMPELINELAVLIQTLTNIIKLFEPMLVEKLSEFDSEETDE